MSLIKWVKSDYEDETRKEMTCKGVPAKEISLRLTPYYNKKKPILHLSIS